jgi:glycosyltransferase involved in cell wall biosynthesis
VHLAAAPLRRRFDIPWVADFRDPWIALHFRTPPTALHRARHAAMERGIFAGADLVLAASRTHADAIQATGAARRVLHLPNGYEPDTSAQARDGESTQSEAAASDPASRGTEGSLRRFRMMFSGTLAQMPDTLTFLDALRSVLARRPELRQRVGVDLVGAYDTEYESRARALGLGDVVRFHGPRPHGETRRLQREADLLLLWKPHGSGYRTMVPGKLYEYLDAGSPLLAVVEAGEEAAELARRGGAEVVEPGRADTLADAIERRVLAWETGVRADPRRPEWLGEHTRAHLARRLAEALNELVGSAP